MNLKELLKIKEPSNWDIFLEWLTRTTRRKKRNERREKR